MGKSYTEWITGFQIPANLDKDTKIKFKPVTEGNYNKHYFWDTMALIYTYIDNISLSDGPRAYKMDSMDSWYLKICVKTPKPCL